MSISAVRINTMLPARYMSWLMRELRSKGPRVGRLSTIEVIVDPEITDGSSQPIVLMSGYNEQDAIDRFSGMGPAGFIQKPFRPLELIGELRKLLPPEDRD